MPSTDANAQQLIGRDIRVTTMDGRILEFRLLDVTEDALVGESQQVRFDDVALLQRRDFNILKNWWFRGAAGMLILVVLFVYSLEQSI